MGAYMRKTGILPVCTNEQARIYFDGKGLTYDDVTEGDILTLVMLLNKHIKRANADCETSMGSMYLSRRIDLKRKTNGTLISCFLYVNSHCQDRQRHQTLRPLHRRLLCSLRLQGVPGERAGRFQEGGGRVWADHQRKEDPDREALLPVQTPAGVLLTDGVRPPDPEDPPEEHHPGTPEAEGVQAPAGRRPDRLPNRRELVQVLAGQSLQNYVTRPNLQHEQPLL